MEYTSIIIVLLLIFMLCSAAIRWLQPNSQKYGSAELLVRHKLLSRRNKGLTIDGVRSLSVKDSCEHVLLEAPTGSGKSTVYTYINTLFLNHSIVVTDVKGELHQVCSGYLKSKGHQVLVFDLADIEHSLRFNPLKRIDEDGIKSFAETLYDISSPNSNESGIWRVGSIAILEVVIKCLKNMESSKFANLANLVFVLRSINVSDKGKGVNSFFARYCPDDETFNMYRSWIQQDEKVASGQLSGALTAVALFDSKNIRALTVNDNIDFNQLRQKKTALFLKVPVGKADEYAPLLTLFYAQLFDFLHQKEPTKEEQTIFLLMEEFSNLKRIPKMSAAISLLRSYRVSLSIVVQSISQISARYGKEDTNTMCANCSGQIVFPGIKNIDSLRRIQELLGTKTHVETDNGRKSINARKILNMDEVMRLPQNRGLFLFRNISPIFLRMRPIYKNRRLMRKAGISSRNGRLVSKYSPVKMPYNDIKDVEYVELEPPPQGNMDTTLELKAMEKLNKFNEKN